ncbi:hypothetical protein B0F90DRAFT_1815614 [Multifurca ochricompacta]|uniref:Uncharacterized protein n=1 Tax=Multifurca ochricompacta TaxID=376703 RepID=A0AAD4M953_9AGAM|nr:hypothetical protein B0F90DRAFT_1815614 [Multifurca ochricompacta]
MAATNLQNVEAKTALTGMERWTFCYRAIECAEKFPNAKVTASPPAEALPWEAGSYVVHVRFLLNLINLLPNPQRVLERNAELVHPGGRLLVEEVSVYSGIQGDAPAVQTAFELFHNANGQIGAQRPISGRGTSSGVHARRLAQRESHFTGNWIPSMGS